MFNIGVTIKNNTISILTITALLIGTFSTLMFAFPQVKSAEAQGCGEFFIFGQKIIIPCEIPDVPGPGPCINCGGHVSIDLSRIIDEDFDIKATPLGNGAIIFSMIPANQTFSTSAPMMENTTTAMGQ